METHFLSISFGLAAAAGFGAGDFAGGIASKKSPVVTVIIFSQITGMLMLLGLAFFLNQSIPNIYNLFLGCLAGICGAFGLNFLYKGLATGKMGIVSPVAAVTGALFPVIIGLFIQGVPSGIVLIGFGFAITAVWLLSNGGTKKSMTLNDLKLPIAAGLGFGLFFIFISQISENCIIWPLISARIASIVLFLSIAKINGKTLAPAKKNLATIIVTGVFDAGGNIFFVLASQAGRLDISVILASLYPAVTVFLAWTILKERLTRSQWAGVWIVLIALMLISQ